MSEQTEREAFAAWVQDCGCDTDGAWSAWMGRAALAASAAVQAVAARPRATAITPGEKNMNKPITITATVACWIGADAYNRNELIEATKRGDGVAVVGALSLYGPPDRKKFGDWVRAGEADVTVRLMPKDEQTRLAVQALQTQLAEERVKWHQRQEAILAEISKLQAITYEGEALENNPSEGAS